MTLAERFHARLVAELADAERAFDEYAAMERGLAGKDAGDVRRPLAALMEDGLGPALKQEGWKGGTEGVSVDHPGFQHDPLVTFLLDAWPENLPRPLQAKEALAVVREEANAIVRAAVEDVEFLAATFVPEDVRSAVLARAVLAERWAWPVWSLSLRAAVCLDAIESALSGVVRAPPQKGLGSGKPMRTTGVAKFLGHPRLEVPPAVAFLEVLKWAREPLVRLSIEGPEVVENVVALGSPFVGGVSNAVRIFTLRGDDGNPGRIASPWVLGVLYEAWADVELGSKRRVAIALDANDSSRSLLEGLVHMPKDTRKGWEVVPSGGYYELAVPGEAQQYALTLPGVHMSEAMQRAIRTLRGPKGIRNWLAFHVGFTVAGRRSGALRWAVEDHMDALRIPLRQRRRTEVVEECVGMAELFLRLELLRRASQHAKDFTRAPIFHVLNWNGREAAGRLRLDGVDFGINPWIYGGVRKGNGELGENFAWAPAELAGIDHVRHPYAVTLGPVLAIRWRIAYAQDGADFVKVSGENVLRAAGADKGYKARDPGRTWHAIARDLEELQRIGALGDYEWDGPPGLRSHLTFHMPTLMRDRMLHGVRPLELASPVPTTGTELRAWREAKGLSQAQVATLLDVTTRTVSRAETRGSERLATPFREVLRRVLADPGQDANGEGSSLVLVPQGRKRRR